MNSVQDALTTQFYNWERRGRGWQVFPEPVAPEPPFHPFHGHLLPPPTIVDDGRVPTFLSSLYEKLTRPQALAKVPDEEPEPEPEVLIREPLIELQTFLPANLNLRRDDFEQFLASLSLCREPVAFELLGTAPQVTAQFAVHPQDAGSVFKQLRAFFPDVVFTPREGGLETAWQESSDADMALVEFGLASEFMIPLATTRIDPFVGIVAALGELQPGELALYQVIFQPVQHPWAESILRAVTDNTGQPFFANAPEITKEAEKKIASPLYAAVVRLATRSGEPDRAWEIARHIAGALGVFARPDGNELIPLQNDDYPFDDHQEDVLRRQCRRSGMLLNTDELIGFVHLPSAEVRSPSLARQTTRTKAAPKSVLGSQGLVLGENFHANRSTPVVLTSEQRVRHMHVVGASGTGKSTFLFNLIRQDIESGEGVAVLDPHGDLVDRILGVIPENRLDDVVLIDPADESFSVGFNILSAHSDLEKTLLASDLVSVFQRLSTSWGDQMGSVLNNAILAFLESDRGGTLADLRRFLIEPHFRADFLQTVRDPNILYYWQKGFTQLSGNKSIGPVITRLDTFLSPKPIRYMVSQPENRLDFGKIMDGRKILLAKLSQGLLGKENSYLLGTLLVAKFQQLAMSRQRQAETSRRDFWLYIDEFHNFITPSMAEILSGARKYRLGLVLAHQELRQLERDSEVASAVLSNSGTRVVFRVGDNDARKLAEGFSFFEARDLQNLETGQAIARTERSDFDFNLSIPAPEEPSAAETSARREAAITASRKKYATPRAAVEAMLYRNLAVEPPAPTLVAKKVPTPAVEKPGSPAPPPKPAVQAPPSVDAPTPPVVPAIPPVMLQIPPRLVEEKSPSLIPAKPAPVETKELGRGGKQHKYLQHLVEQLAIGLNFEVEVEKEILDGDGSVDVALKKGEQRFAFEISVTTGTEHEVGNLRKCLTAGFNKVVMVCVEPVALGKLREAAHPELSEPERDRIRFCLPDQISPTLIEFSAGAASKDTISHGRKTRVTYRPVSEEDARRKRETLAQISTQSLKKLKSA